VAVLAVKLSLYLATIGLVMNLVGTILLVFSLPTGKKFEYENGIQTETSLVPGENDSEFQFTRDVFRIRVIKEKNRPLLVALSLLLFGAALQILSLVLDS
jgi:hypothetical protein